MANRFLNNITINDQYTLPSSDGTNGQVLSTTGAADGTTELVFVDQSTLSTGSSRTTTILVKNISAANGGVSLSKGDPVYIYGSIGASERLYIDKADADSTATNNLGNAKMPCVGILAQDLATNGEGEAVVTGKLTNLITSPIDGSTPSENDTIYVKSGGGLTLTKPTGASNRIQNVGQVGRVSTSSDGNIVVSAILRSNDVPNLNAGKIWVGSSTYTTESSVVHLDESQGRMGINNTSPAHALDVSGTIATDSGFLAVATQPSLTFIDSSGGGSVYTSAGSMYFSTGVGSPTVKMAILSGGNVGIGVTNPSEKLEVSGKILATGGQVRAGSYLESFPSFSFANDIDTGMFSDTADQLEFATAGSSRVTIDSSGNIGIGTTSPSEKLEVQGSINNDDIAILIENTYDDNLSTSRPAAALLFSTASNNGYLRVYGAPADTAANHQIDLGSTAGSSYLTFSPSGSEKMRVTSAGDIGVGTITPGARAHIYGPNHSGAFTTGALMIQQSSDNARMFIDGNDIDSADGNLYLNDYSQYPIILGGVLQVGNAGNSYFTGNVGIGTTSPGSKLHVSGAIQNDQFTIPNTAGTSGQVLAWPATGTTLEWTTAGGGGGASSLNDLSDCETTTTSVYVANVPASNSGNDNTVLGINAANSITSGSNNTIIGNSAAPVMTTQSYNVIIGADACGADTTPGNSAVVVGSMACYYEAQIQQVAIGDGASFTDGAIGGVSIGYTAGRNAGASYAINVGSQAGYKSGGIGGVNIGYQAGYNSSASGTYNVSLGYKAGYSITTGDDNVSIGKNANDASNVSDTVVIGTEAGGNGAADGAIYIGRTAANKSGAYGSGVDSIVIGHLAAASSSTAANEVTISPDQGTTNARFDAGDTAWSFSSDARLKENVEDLELGLDFIDQIQPRTFDWKKSGEKSSGFIAQELLEVVKNNNADYTNIVNTDDAECYTVAQAALVPILVNAIKKLKAEIDILKSKQ